MALKRNVSFWQGLKYKGGGPMWAWILHRVTGLSILLFVGLHVLAAFMTAQFGSDLGIAINVIYESWIFQLFIYFSILFHAVNGIRVILLDLWPQMLAYEREAIWAEWLVIIPVFGLAAFIIITKALGG